MHGVTHSEREKCAMMNVMSVEADLGEFVSREKIFINVSKPYITFRGDGQDNTIIQWGDKAGDFDDQDVLLKTYKSATVGVNSQYFIAENIQFRVCMNACMKVCTKLNKDCGRLNES